MDKCSKNSTMFYVSIFSIAIVLGTVVFYNYFLEVKNIKEGFISGLFGGNSKKENEKFETFVEKKRKEKCKNKFNLVEKVTEMLKIAMK
jgi:TctA family transporter